MIRLSYNNPSETGAFYRSLYVHPTVAEEIANECMFRNPANDADCMILLTDWEKAIDIVNEYAAGGYAFYSETYNARRNRRTCRK